MQFNFNYLFKQSWIEDNNFSSQTSRVAKIENVPESPFELFEDFFKEATTHILEGSPPTLNIATCNK